MMFRTCSMVAGLLMTAALGFGASAQDGSAKATLKGPDGKEVGTVEFKEAAGGVLLVVSVKGLPAGPHAFHIHEVGKCEPPFTSAGGHFNPEKEKHGLLADEGHHAGDMPNLHIPSSGELTVEIMNTAVSLEKGEPNSLLDADGSAVVIHAKADDYKSDPAGAAGDRIACGVIQ
jgi:superoxide dismutase, Cu-Zn family